MADWGRVTAWNIPRKTREKTGGGTHMPQPSLPLSLHLQPPRHSETGQGPFTGDRGSEKQGSRLCVDGGPPASWLKPQLHPLWPRGPRASVFSSVVMSL